MNNSPHQANLLRRTAIALTQLHRLLQQATDILADLHNLFLHHTGQVDQHFQRSFPPLPPPPSFTIPLPSPTSSCDSAPAPAHQHSPTPRKPAASLDSSSPSPSPQRPQPKKRRQPAPPLNSHADWDAWGGEADCRLLDSVEQCKARWEELQDLQRLQDMDNCLSPPPTTSPDHSLLFLVSFTWHFLPLCIISTDASSRDL